MKVDKLAPGMSLIVKLRFEPKHNKEYHESIVFETDD